MCSVQFVLFTVFVGLGCSLASDKVRIEVSPAKVTEGDGRTVTISCVDVHTTVLMISITNGSASPIVYIRDKTRVSYTNQDIRNRSQASGLLSTTNTGNFLKVNLTSPAIEDSGVYTCRITFLDQSGVVSTDQASAVLTVEAPVPIGVTTETPPFGAESVLYNLLDRLVEIQTDDDPRPYWIIGLTDQEREDLMNEFGKKNASVSDKDSQSFKIVMGRLARLEAIVYASTVAGNITVHDTGSKIPGVPQTDKKLVQRVDKLENENKNLSRQIDWLSNNAIPDPTAATITTDVLKRVKDLESQSSKHSTDLATLTIKDTSTSAFHATFGELSRPLKKGMEIDFSNVMTQRGKGYDKKTGTFTAPKDGLYGFDLVVDSYGRGMCKIAIKAGGKYMSLLVTEAGLGNQGTSQTSTSAVIYLKAGEKVSAVVIDFSGRLTLKGYGYSTFTGYLIWSK